MAGAAIHTSLKCRGNDKGNGGVVESNESWHEPQVDGGTNTRAHTRTLRVASGAPGGRVWLGLRSRWSAPL